MDQGVEQHPTVKIIIIIKKIQLKVVNELIYLSSRHLFSSGTFSLDIGVNRRFGRAATTFAMLKPIVWENRQLTMNTKDAVYRECLLLYGSTGATPQRFIFPA